jgi:voltage-gated potassium channel
MADETRLERRLDRVIERALSPRSAALVVASVTTTITVLAGVVITVTDRESFPSIGTGLWWAVQTVTTVGYGDVVPASSVGRTVAAFVMLLGIGFVTVITAAITSAFVARSRSRLAESERHPNAEHLRAIDERLSRIEEALSRDR